jgi:hypothetical protein
MTAEEIFFSMGRPPWGIDLADRSYCKSLFSKKQGLFVKNPQNIDKNSKNSFFPAQRRKRTKRRGPADYTSCYSHFPQSFPQRVPWKTLISSTSS